MLGGGAGFKTYWLRTDVTVDWAPATKFKATASSPGDVTAQIGHVTALFNMYADLCTWDGFTPYVGAGVGTAYLTMSDYASASVPPLSPVLAGLSGERTQVIQMTQHSVPESNMLTNAAMPRHSKGLKRLSIFSPDSPAVLGHSQWNVAWAATAGASYNVPSNILADVAYRYVHLRTAQTAADSFGSLTLNQFSAHELRFRVRWMFNDPFPIP